jgi:hypothetical protein
LRSTALLLYPFFLDGVAATAVLNLPDGMHPNAEGVDVIVRASCRRSRNCSRRPAKSRSARACARPTAFPQLDARPSSRFRSCYRMQTRPLGRTGSRSP